MDTGLLAMPISDRVKELRTAAGLTQQALAMRAGLSMSAVIHIERGRIPDPRVSTIQALAKALGCSVDALLDESGRSANAAPEAEPTPAKKTGRKAKGE